jgi:hypothetical protein
MPASKKQTQKQAADALALKVRADEKQAAEARTSKVKAYLAQYAKGSEKQKQMGVALPDYIKTYLEKDAQASGHSIATEIRQRIEYTILLEERRVLEVGADGLDWSYRSLDSLLEQYRQFDSTTVELGFAIGHLARAIEVNTGIQWWKHPKAREALIEAICTWLAFSYVASDPSTTEADPWGAGDPQTVGRMLARGHRLNQLGQRYKNSLVGSLRKIYGPQFAGQFKDTDKLIDVFHKLDTTSLSQLLTPRPGTP